MKVLLICALMLVSSSDKPEDQQEAIQRFYDKGVEAFEGKSLVEVRKIGHLIKEDIKKGKVGNAEKEIIYGNLIFDGMTVQGLFNESNEFLVSDVTITDSSWPVFE